MGWKGTVRSIQAAQRAAERDARRRERERERADKAATHQTALDDAALEVEVYEAAVDDLVSLHQDRLERWDWKAIRAQLAPQEPAQAHDQEAHAVAALQSFKPSSIDRALRRGESKRRALETKVAEAKTADVRATAQAQREFAEEQRDWEDMQRLAGNILKGEFSAYVEVLEGADIFDGISPYSTPPAFSAEAQDSVTVTLRVPGDEHIPRQTKSLLKSGKLSSKETANGKRNELYQDHVCSLALRSAADCVALVPVDFALVHVRSPWLNEATGHLEDRTILSVSVPRETLTTLNLSRIDPSEAMANFVHRMDFKRASGFRPVEPLSSKFEHDGS
ncbi:MAG: hypothetical protein O7A71_03805 [Chloroflexi bacterium]|nr:hypothetical protein [Chloroflexota bacterium]